jgi:hypothetical protein
MYTKKKYLYAAAVILILLILWNATSNTREYFKKKKKKQVKKTAKKVISSTSAKKVLSSVPPVKKVPLEETSSTNIPKGSSTVPEKSATDLIKEARDAYKENVDPIVKKKALNNYLTLYQKLDNDNWNKTRNLIPIFYNEYKRALVIDDKEKVDSITAEIKAQGGDNDLFRAFL